MTLRELKALTDAELSRMVERRFHEQLHIKTRPMCQALGVAVSSWYTFRSGEKELPAYVRMLLRAISLLDQTQLRALVSGTPTPLQDRVNAVADLGL